MKRVLKPQCLTVTEGQPVWFTDGGRQRSGDVLFEFKHENQTQYVILADGADATPAQFFVRNGYDLSDHPAKPIGRNRYVEIHSVRPERVL